SKAGAFEGHRLRSPHRHTAAMPRPKGTAADLPSVGECDSGCLDQYRPRVTCPEGHSINASWNESATNKGEAFEGHRLRGPHRHTAATPRPKGRAAHDCSIGECEAPHLQGNRPGVAHTRAGTQPPTIGSLKAHRLRGPHRHCASLPSATTARPTVDLTAPSDS